MYVGQDDHWPERQGRDGRPVHELSEDRQENARVLRVPDDAVDAVGEQLVAGEIDLAPACDDHNQARTDECIADRHFDSGANRTITEQRRPEVTAVMNQRDRKSTRLNYSPSCANRMPSSD